MALKPLIFSCSGGSDVGELADRIVRKLARDGLVEICCLAGIAAERTPFLQKLKAAERVVVVDGCPHHCAARILENAGFTRFFHIPLNEIGCRKGNCPATDDRVGSASKAVSYQIRLALGEALSIEIPVL